MKKLIVVFCFSFLPFVFVYPQSGVESDCCDSMIENIFKVLGLKVKYELIQYLYEESEKENSILQILSDEGWIGHFGLPMNYRDTIPSEKKVIRNSRGEFVEVEKVTRIPMEEVKKYIKQLNCTPDEAFRKYGGLIEKIKSEKEKYLRCLNAEFAKGDLSVYQDKHLGGYNYLPPEESNGLVSVTKLNFLKIFKEYIFNQDEEVLPECFRVRAYIQGNCRTNPFMNPR